MYNVYEIKNRIASYILLIKQNKYSFTIVTFYLKMYLYGLITITYVIFNDATIYFNTKYV